ncbi:MAG: enoyl-CoA hydratase/isomerase family protein [Alphaproteobacteria bacterium]|nr:enoyl-CoA hydratase [Rhizobiaceae bacterium]MBU3962863.1 enoyl-CoA hydratase/isomerase family protein [Alphaproteobacteria bacterium]MBU4051497.1 enoyl-CoA hydratase/isomerase family protein [Alphaproteobacteria bacterium]MBU4087910.1 enoyl-CoA hydratase/isomerase family protein [Alphaproteobacteria bacterium]MBU4156253.1 enoyl-CoA hydratase/isomerase family protein [Alphaproteobacteria bacterium]
MTDELIVERRGKVLWLTLNRPNVHNALNAALVEALVDALEAASTDETLRAVVLTGAGERSFCSGADLKESAGAMFSSKDGVNPIAEVLRAIEACNRPVIARINGAVLAGGIGLVAACDLAYAAEHAKFGLPEVRVGLFPMMVAAKLLPVMDLRRLQEMAYLGEGFTAATAVACGLITRCVPSAELDAVLSGVLVALDQGSPAAIQAGKQALRGMRDMDGRDRLAFAERAIADLSDTAEAREGRTAFAEKRKPRWVD